MQLFSRQRGFSLIEVLVAIVVFSLGVLGIALLQLKGAQFTKQSGSRTVAVLQARSIADAMRANPAGVYGVTSMIQLSTPAARIAALPNSYYLYNGVTAPDPTQCGGVASCTQAKKDLQAWLAQLKLSTAASAATVTVNTATGTLTVISSWNGLIQDQNGATTNDKYQFDYQP